MGACITPFYVRDKISQENIPVPCGKCPECKSRRVSGWSFRLQQEGKISSSAHFLTLTYDTSFVPISPDGEMQLCVRDVQLFIKRLRKRAKGKLPIKYYLVGEYGTKTLRPHYHLILFNAELSDIQPAWDMGDIYYGEVNGASIGYTLKYMCKESKLDENDTRKKEFSLMSKRLGAAYLTAQMVNWHRNDMLKRICIMIEDNKRIAMPRYFKGKIFTEKELKVIAEVTAIGHEERQKKYEAEMFKVHGRRASTVKAEFDRQSFKKMHRNAVKDRKDYV